jgi:hypothetical protein
MLPKRAPEREKSQTWKGVISVAKAKAKPKAKAKAKAAPKAAKCAGKTKSGKACTNYAVGRSKFCKLHQKKR